MNLRNFKKLNIDRSEKMYYEAYSNDPELEYFTFLIPIKIKREGSRKLQFSRELEEVFASQARRIASCFLDALKWNGFKVTYRPKKKEK